MQRRGSARLGVILLIILIAAVAIGGIVCLAQFVFSDNGQPAGVEQQANLLTEPTEQTVVSMSVRGPVTALENHYDIDLEISTTRRRVVIYRGYNRAEEIKRIELDNDQGAFTDFLLALNNNGYLTASGSEMQKNDGLCAEGQLITFGLRDGDQVKSELWTSSCGAVSGTFGGNSTQVIALLLNQIPGAKDAIGEAKRSLTP